MDVTKTKPFNIDKKLVYDAYKAVKANAGAAGVDRQTLEQFDKDLMRNLYKIWNRMRSYAGFWVTRRSGGVGYRHFDDLDAVLKSDTCNDLGQVVCAFESSPCC